MPISPQEWDVIVVGGGPAGMMAAGRAAERGGKVLLLEKNPGLGKKLLITGGGRCNVTNAESDVRKLLAKFKESADYLFSAFSQWNTQDTLSFFNNRGMATKVENELRVFPLSNKAQSVWDVVVGYMREHGVVVESKSSVVGFVRHEEKIVGVRLKDKTEILARSIILATGGISHPETGSTGDGFQWLEEVGHTVKEPVASLVPIAVHEEWVSRIAGLTLPEVKVTVLNEGVKQEKVAGKVLFTHVGLSGPTILNLSRSVGELLKYGQVTLSLDILPTMDHSVLNKKLQEIFAIEDKKKFKNSLSSLVPASLAPIIVMLSGIDPDKQSNGVTREERLKLVDLLKHLDLTVKGLLGEDKAITTSGGISLDEVDFKTMRSRLFPNLYVVGDILNIDRPSGGYSLQLCWTTGFVAGNSVEV